jgi:hypothetical protein
MLPRCSRLWTLTTSIFGAQRATGSMPIEIEIDAHPAGGLRVIRHIPAVRPCRLEGRNGIGKTVAVRLLSLASGEQPYSDDEASWRSLRELIGQATIRFSGLVGVADEAVLTFTPAKWPTEVPLEIGDWLGTLTLDGIPRPLSDLFSQLEVVHLSGTERLDSTIDRRRGTYQVALRETARRLRALEEQRLQLGEMAERVESLTPSQENRDLESRAQSDRQLRVVDTQRTALQARMKDLQRASTLNLLIEAGTDADREQEIAKVRAERADADRLIRKTQAELTAAVKELSQGSSIQKALATEERRLTRARNRANKARSERTDLALKLDLSSIAECTDNVLSPDLHQQTADLVSSITAKLRELEHERYRNSLGTSQKTIHDQLTVVLSEAIAAGNADFVLGRLDDRDLTVGDLARALATAPTATGSATDDNELVELQQRQTRLKAILDLDAHAADVEKDTEGILRKISDLRHQTPTTDDLQLRVDKARTEQQRALEKAEELARRLGALQAGRLDVSGIQGAERERDELLTRNSVALDGLADEIGRGMAELAECTREATRLREIVADLDAADARRRITRRTLAAQLRSDPGLGWVTQAAGLGEPGHTETEVDWEGLAGRLATLRSVIGSLVSGVEALETVSGSGAGASEGRYGEAIQIALEAEAVRDFSDPPLLAALFDDGVISHFDLRNSTVTWHTANGETRSRPLSAFSSGEGALGFIRARLRQIAAAEKANRLIFLDEFGAFIAADARRPLAELLTSSEIGALASQVIVMLPLQVDYAAELDQTTDELHERYAERVAQLSDRGYFVEEFST